jgi:hypothetical protein
MINLIIMMLYGSMIIALYALLLRAVKVLEYLNIHLRIGRDRGVK